jgi:tRNA (guanosine-2'-O-)-methyltransferase
MRGYYGIGIENVKTAENVGTLWRSAYILGASFIFTIGKRYKKQAKGFA